MQVHRRMHARGVEAAVRLAHLEAGLRSGDRSMA
jgi:hypothetical protein